MANVVIRFSSGRRGAHCACAFHFLLPSFGNGLNRLFVTSSFSLRPNFPSMGAVRSFRRRRRHC